LSSSNPEESEISDEENVFCIPSLLDPKDHLTKQRKITTRQFTILKSIVVHLFNRRKNPEAVFDELLDTYHGFIPELRTIKAWYALWNAKRMKSYPRKHLGRKKKQSLLEPLKQAVEESPSSSARALGKKVGAHHQTVKKKLTEDLRMRYASVTRVPHLLLPSHIERRKEIASDLKDFLYLQQKENFARIFTGDESWIQYDNSSHHVWIEKGTTPPEHPKIDIASKKLLLTVFFTGERVWHISFLPRGKSMDSNIFIENVHTSLHDAVLKAKSKPIRPWFLHFDNARPHVSLKTQTFLKATNFIHVPNPPYSPDLSPSDFFLFGSLKRHLLGRIFTTEKELIDAVEDFLQHLPQVTLQRVFNTWLSRCEQVSELGGYYSKKKEEY
jgi:histone-lysine N-methyltransferase SETMAR